MDADALAAAGDDAATAPAGGQAAVGAAAAAAALEPSPRRAFWAASPSPSVPGRGGASSAQTGRDSAAAGGAVIAGVDMAVIAAGVDMAGCTAAAARPDPLDPPPVATSA